MARLWKVFHGEPFMINPVLGVIGAGVNPNTKKRRVKKMARRSSRGARHMAWVRSFKRKNPRRRKYRRNPYAMAGPVAAALNPRRRRRRYASNPRRRHYRRNPVSIRGLGLPPLMPIVYGGVGFAGTAWAEGFITGMLPLEWTGNLLAKYAVKIGSVLGVTWLAGMALGKAAKYMVGIGGGIYVIKSAAHDFVPGVIPGMEGVRGPLNLSAYRRAHTGMGQPANLAAYREMRGPRQLASPVFGAANTTATGGITNVVASRFRRLN